MHRVKRLTDVHAVSSLKVSLIFFCLYLLFAASFLLLHSHLLFVFLCTCCTLTFLSLPPIIVPHLYLSFYPCSFFIFFVSLNLFTPFPLFFFTPTDFLNISRLLFPPQIPLFLNLNHPFSHSSTPSLSPSTFMTPFVTHHFPSFSPFLCPLFLTSSSLSSPFSLLLCGPQTYLPPRRQAAVGKV